MLKFIGQNILRDKKYKFLKTGEELPDAIRKLLGECKTVIPQKNLKKHYYNKYKIYLNLYKNLKNLFPKFDEIN